MHQQAKLLEVDNLTVTFTTPAGTVTAIDGISFQVPPGQTLAMVGESGCGKSVTALSIMRLLPRSNAHIASGSLRFEGRELTTLKEGELRQIRGNRIGMIFQEPMTSLNPVFTVGYQIGEALRAHTALKRKERRERAAQLLRKVGIPEPEARLKAYPHQLSGGMRQRVMIAIAIACDPALLIADEPTTALDVTVQAQIMSLLGHLQRDLGMSMLLITHDLGLVAEHAHTVAVMYAGRIVEYASVEVLFATPHHPYTQGLLRSIPYRRQHAAQTRLHTIPGMVPQLTNLPSGCRFRDRCTYADETCAAVDPPLESKTPDHLAACHHPVNREEG